MALIISGSIDLNKIDKSKIKTTDKNGNPFKNGAKYYEVNILVNDDIDQYNNNAGLMSTFGNNTAGVWDDSSYYSNTLS